MPEPIRLTTAAPIGTRTGPAFVDYADGRDGGLEELTLPIYQLPAVDLRSIRKELGIGLREGATRLGITPGQLSGLERGSLVPLDGWDSVVERLRHNDMG